MPGIANGLLTGGCWEPGGPALALPSRSGAERRSDGDEDGEEPDCRRVARVDAEESGEEPRDRSYGYRSSSGGDERDESESKSAL